MTSHDNTDSRHGGQTMRTFTRFSVAVIALGTLSLGGCRRSGGSNATAWPSTYRRLATIGPDGADRICWSPDGQSLALQRVLYDGDRVKSRWIDVIDARDGRTVLKTGGPLDVDPIWLPGGRSFLHTAARGSHDVDVYETSLDTPARRLVPGSAEVWTGRGDQAWLNENLVVCFRRYSRGHYQLEVLEAHTRKFRKIPVAMPEATNPAASPDGHSIAFVGQSGLGKICAVATYPQGAIRFRSNVRSGAAADLRSGVVADVCWGNRPDTVLYTSLVGDGGFLHRVDLGSKSDRIIGTASDFRMPMSVNSDDVLAVGVIEAGGAKRIRLMNVATGKVISSSPKSLSCDTPAWSPDGRFLAFEADRDGHTDLLVIPAAVALTPGWAAK